MSPRQSLFLIPIIVVACSGGGGETSTPPAPLAANVAVAASTTPVLGTMGVMSEVTSGTFVFALTTETNTATTSAIKIVTNKAKTGGDPSTLIGGTFIEFDGLPKINDIGVVESQITPKTVNECDLQISECMEIPFEKLTSNRIAFSIRSGKFYAIER